MGSPRCHSLFARFLLRHVMTDHPSLRTIGIPTRRMPQAVWIFFSILHSAISDVFSDTPEAAPGAVLGTQTTTSTGTSTSTSESTTPPGPVKKLGAGAIAGIISGAVAIVAAGLAIFWWRRKRTQAVVDGGALQAPVDGSRLPVSNNGVYMPLSQLDPETPTAIPMRLYVRPSMSPSRSVYVLMPFLSYLQDPNDPTTFPGFQGPQGAMASPNESENTPPTANMQTSWPQGYHGYPIV